MLFLAKMHQSAWLDVEKNNYWKIIKLIYSYFILFFFLNWHNKLVNKNKVCIKFCVALFQWIYQNVKIKINKLLQCVLKVDDSFYKYVKPFREELKMQSKLWLTASIKKRRSLGWLTRDRCEAIIFYFFPPQKRLLVFQWYCWQYFLC